MKNIFLFAATILINSLFIILSCNKDDPNPQSQPNNVPAIISISPLTGGYNTIVTITGSNFSGIRTENIVKFNGNIAPIVIAETGKLIVSVPLLAGTGPVTITIGNNTVSGPVFTYVSTGTVTTFSGTGNIGHVDGPSNIAQFNYPHDIAVDIQGNIYVSDNFQIRKITPIGFVSTLAGTGIRGFYDGPGDSAQFNTPAGITVDPQGYVYVADRDRIRKIAPNGNVSTLAGSSTYGYQDGVGANAKFWEPVSVAIDAQGNIFVADRSNYRIRKVTSGGVVSTFAGKGIAGHSNGTGINAEFYNLSDIAVDDQGNVYVIDAHRIRKITTAGVVSDYAGSGSINVFNGVGVNADFDNPDGLGIDKNGNIYIGEGSDLIRKINTSTSVSTFAGSIPAGYIDGPAQTAKFNNPKGLGMDVDGNIYVADFANHRIRKILVQ